MNRPTSIYLDLVRFLAAFTVFIDHLSSQKFSAGLLWQFEHLGDQAVIVFFVLSGFVIAYVTDTRERDLRTYALNRTARIYSVALPALLLTLLLDMTGRIVDPNLYASIDGEARYPAWIQYAASALFVSDIWAAGITPGTNRVYWSLGFEVWYYVAFAAVMFVPAKLRAIALVAVLLIVGPAIALLMPIWFLGVGLYYACKAPPSGALGICAFVGSIGLWLVYELMTAPDAGWTVAATTLLPRNEIPQDYLIAVLFALNVYGFASLSSRLSLPPPALEWVIRWCAGATFSLYLVHLPILFFLTAVSPWPEASATHRLLLGAATLVAVFAFAAITERRKQDWRTSIEWLAQSVSRTFRAGN